MNRSSYDTVFHNQEESNLPLAYYVHAMRRRWGKVALFVAICVTAAVIWSHFAARMYEAETVIELDKHSPSTVIGQDPGFSSLAETDQYIATQVLLIQSDEVLRPVLSRHPGLVLDDDSAGFVGGAPKPIVLKGLRVSRPPNTFLLQVSYRSTDPKLSAAVANDIAGSYLQAVNQKRESSLANSAEFLQKQVETVKLSMEHSGEALARTAQEMSLINPEQRTSMLSTRLSQLSAELANAQSARMQKEAAANQARSGAAELLEASDQGEALRRALDRLNDAKQKMADAAARYGPNYPDYKRAAALVAESQKEFDASKNVALGRIDADYHEAQNRESLLQGEFDRTKAEFDQMNARFFEYQQRKEEAAADQKLYDDLLRKGREARINESYDAGSVRIAEAALVPQRPVSPNLPENIAIALLGSLMISAIAGLSSEALDSSVRDPEQIGRMLNADVLGIVPLVKGRFGPGSPGASGRAEESGFTESIRTLSNALLNADLKPAAGSVLVTSAAPREGKSTVAAWLASANAKQGLRTLLMDVDFKAPCLHKYLGIERGKGMADVLRGEAEWRTAVVELPDRHGLCVLTAGANPMPSDGIRGPLLAEVIREARKEYQTVILDGPPLLGFADPTQLARMVEGVLVVAKSGSTDRKALRAVLGTLERLNATILGVVLNQLDDRVSGPYYYVTKKYRSSMRERASASEAV